jgi:hypothetical protein
MSTWRIAPYENGLGPDVAVVPQARLGKGGAGITGNGE